MREEIDRKSLEAASAEGQRRFASLFQEDQELSRDLLGEEPAPDEQSSGGAEAAYPDELARAREDIQAPLLRVVTQDEGGREALERRRTHLEQALAKRQRAQVERPVVDEAVEGFRIGSIGRVARPPYPGERTRELTRSGVGRVNHLEADGGFLGFDIESAFDDGVVRCDAWTGVVIRPPAHGPLHVWTNPYVSYDYDADRTMAQDAIAYASLWLLISRYADDGRFIGPRPYESRRVLFNEHNRSGSGAGRRGFTADIHVSPQYRYGIWVRLYGKVASNKGNMPLANLWSSMALASSEVYVPSISYVLDG